MATHDYVIDNQSAPSFRSDLNNALQAIVTQNSSATAPTTTYADMVWYDTANNQIKKRNEANSGWIALGTVDEGLGTFTSSGERQVASQAEAEVGTDNTKVITPLRVRNALNATGTAPIYACRAWVNFNGTGTPAIRASGNVSSITDNGTGNYRLNFATAMPDANYSAVGNSKVNDDNALEGRLTSFYSFLTTSISMRTHTAAPNASDCEVVTVAIFR